MFSPFLPLMFMNQLPCEVQFDLIFRALAMQVGKTVIVSWRISSFHGVNLQTGVSTKWPTTEKFSVSLQTLLSFLASSVIFVSRNYYHDILIPETNLQCSFYSLFVAPF